MSSQLPSKQKHVAIVGQIAANTGKQANKNQIRERIEGKIQQLNQAWAGIVLVSPLTLSHDFQIQGVFGRWSMLPNVITDITETAYPFWLNFGLGTASGIFEANMQGFRTNDGVCLEHARVALTDTGRNKSWVRCFGFGQEFDQTLTTLYRLMAKIRRAWTRKQAQYCFAARNMSQKEVALRYGVSPSVVSESLKAANYKEILEAERTVSNLLHSLQKQSA